MRALAHHACAGRPRHAPSRAQGKVQTEAKGKITIPDLSEETYDDLEMTVTLDDETNAKVCVRRAALPRGPRPADARRAPRDQCSSAAAVILSSARCGGAVRLKAVGVA